MDKKLIKKWSCLDVSSVLIRCLIYVVIIIMAISVSALFGFLPNVFVENLTALSAMVLSCGVLIASFTYSHNKKSQLSESQRKSDEILYLLAKDGFSEVYSLLEDLNNDNVIWIRAARILCETLELKKSIKHDEYKIGYDIVAEKLRNQLYRLLQIESENPDQEDRKSLPPQFFYGVKNWRDNNLSLDNAAINSKSPSQAYRSKVDEVLPMPKDSRIESRSVVAIYNFIKSHDDYVDPLSKIKTWGGDGYLAMGIDDGPRKYVGHFKKYYVQGGKLLERETNLL